ncbi:MAG TPA: hypothetical protein VJT15_13410 [Pyrinomonadaceae bacterium]|nr:hypothetical protein [Pyrinomonadaceae bacterium]
MNLTVNSALANLIRQADPEVEFRLEAQADALRDSRCIDYRLGQWLVDDVDYLTAVLDLDDFNFTKRFPSIAHYDEQKRQQMKAEIQHHLEFCQHCALRYGYALEMDARILRVCQENKEDLLRLFDEEAMDLAGVEHLDAAAWTNSSEGKTNSPCEPKIKINPLVEST